MSVDVKCQRIFLSRWGEKYLEKLGIFFESRVSFAKLPAKYVSKSYPALALMLALEVELAN